MMDKTLSSQFWLEAMNQQFTGVEILTQCTGI